MAPGNRVFPRSHHGKTKLTKSAVDAAQPQAQPVELRDTLVPGFMCKVTPAGRKVFMLQYRTNAGQRRKPALGLYGELTVEQARSLAQEWLAEVRRGGDPGAAKTAARKAPTVAELCEKFMEDHSRQRNKPSTQAGYQKCIKRNIVPMLGRMKVQDVTRPDVAGAMKKMAHKPADANRTFSVMRKMFNLAEVWGYRPDGTNPCRHVPMYPNGKATHLISDEEMGKLFRYLDYLKPMAWGWIMRSCRWPSGCNSSSRADAPRSSPSNGIGWIWKTGVWSGPTARPAACPSP